MGFSKNPDIKSSTIYTFIYIYFKNKILTSINFRETIIVEDIRVDAKTSNKIEWLNPTRAQIHNG
jgi:hypothetical protein